MNERMSPIQMIALMHDIVFNMDNKIDRKTEMLLEEAFERLLKKEKEGDSNGCKK